MQEISEEVNNFPKAKSKSVSIDTSSVQLLTQCMNIGT